MFKQKDYKSDLFHVKKGSDINSRTMKTGFKGPIFMEDLVINHAVLVALAIN